MKKFFFLLGEALRSSNALRVFLLCLPLLAAVGLAYLISSLSLWLGITIVVCSSILLFFVANYAKKRIGTFAFNEIIPFFVYFGFVFLAERHDVYANHLGAIPLVIGSLMIIIVLLFSRKKNNEWQSHNGFFLPEALLRRFYFLVNIVGIFLIVRHIDTQFVWLPIIALSLYNFLALAVYEINCLRKWEKRLGEKIIFLSLGTGLVSTIVQFWFPIINFFSYEWFWGIKIWVDFVTLIVLVAAFFGLKFFVKRLKNKKATEKKRQEIIEADKKRKEKADADAAEVKKRQDELQAKKDELQAKIDELMEIGDILSDKDIYFLISNVKPSVLFGKNGLKKCLPGDFIKKLPLALSEVSEIKKQIIWPNSLANNLQFIENAIRASSIDPIIRICVSQVYDFLDLILKYENYKGQCEIFSFILSDCSCTINCMSEIYNKENKGTSIFPKFLLIQKYLEIIQREK